MSIPANNSYTTHYVLYCETLLYCLEQYNL